MPRRACSAGWCRAEQSELRLGTVSGKQSRCTLFYFFETSDGKQPWGELSLKCWKALGILSTQHFAGETHNSSGAQLTEGPHCCSLCSSRFSCVSFPSAAQGRWSQLLLPGWASSSASKAPQHYASLPPYTRWELWKQCSRKSTGTLCHSQQHYYINNAKSLPTDRKTSQHTSGEMWNSGQQSQFISIPKVNIRPAEAWFYTSISVCCMHTRMQIPYMHSTRTKSPFIF